MLEKTKIIQNKSHFDDFEELSQTVHKWGLELFQMDCGEFKGELHQILVPQILLTWSSFNRTLVKKGNHPEGMRSFALMAEGSSPYKWHNQEVTQNSLIVTPKGDEIDSTSFPEFNQYTLSFSEHFLLERLQRWGNQTQIEEILKRGGIVEGDPQNVWELRFYLKSQFLAIAANPALTILQPFQDKLYEELPHYLFNILNSQNQRSNTLSSLKRNQLLKNIEPWVLENLQGKHLVRILCETFDVNERTLLRMFQDKYGVSTSQYLLSLRLNMVRKELYAATYSRGSISSIANGWGFWHMGDFARVYHRQFGELPKETLLKRQRIHVPFRAELNSY